MGTPWGHLGTLLGTQFFLGDPFCWGPTRVPGCVPGCVPRHCLFWRIVVAALSLCLLLLHFSINCQVRAREIELVDCPKALRAELVTRVDQQQSQQHWHKGHNSLRAVYYAKRKLISTCVPKDLGPQKGPRMCPRKSVPMRNLGDTLPFFSDFEDIFLKKRGDASVHFFAYVKANT